MTPNRLALLILLALIAGAYFSPAPSDNEPVASQPTTGGGEPHTDASPASRSHAPRVRGHVTAPRRHSSTPTGRCRIHGRGLQLAPDRRPQCTPGQWIADSDLATAHVCRRGYNPRPPESTTAALKAQTLALYGLPPSAASQVEGDHLYPLWLGGATTLENLWPERNYARAPDAYTHNPKDAVEFAVYKRVCWYRTLSVAQARALFEGDWRKVAP